MVMNMFNKDYCLLIFMGVVSLNLFCFALANTTETLNTELDGGFLVVAGGFDFYYDNSQNVFIMNTDTRKWFIMADLPTANKGSQLFYADGKLFSVGGYAEPSSFLIYNITDYTWTALNNLNSKIGDSPCGAILNGSLYLIGGTWQESGTQVMNPISIPKWKPGAKLQRPRSFCGAATLGDHVYTCGDRYYTFGNDYPEAKSCEKFDPVSNSWSFIASMNDYRMGKTLVALNGYLYAVGGNNLGTAERYDPATNEWSYIQPVNDKSRSFSAAVTNGKLIYLVGGCSGYCYYGSETNTVEVYIPDLNEWILFPPLPEARAHIAIAYLPQMPIGSKRKGDEI